MAQTYKLLSIAFIVQVIYANSNWNDITPEKFVERCIHLGKEQGNWNGDDLTRKFDIMDMSQAQFSQSFITQYHVNQVTICENDQQITGLQFRLGLHAGSHGEISGSEKDIMGQRLGSTENCKILTVPELRYVKQIFIRSNKEMITNLSFVMSDGDEHFYGKDPDDPSAFSHVYFEFSDKKRLMGLYGHEKIVNGKNIMVGLGLLRNDCSEFHLVDEVVNFIKNDVETVENFLSDDTTEINSIEEVERSVFGLAILVIILICIFLCCLYCLLKNRGKFCPKKKEPVEIQLPDSTPEKNRE